MTDIVFPGDAPQGIIGIDLLPANYDLVLYQGDDFVMDITIKDALGNAVDLTGATGKCSLKSNYTAPSSFDATCTLADAANGVISVSFPATLTSTLIPGAYIYDFQVTDSAGKTRTYLSGDVNVYSEVTK